MTFDMLKEYPDLMFVEQVAEALEIRKTTVYAWIRRKELPAFRAGRFYRVPKSCLIDFVNRAIA